MYVYVVTFEEGEYDSYHTWVHDVYRSAASAAANATNKEYSYTEIFSLDDEEITIEAIYELEECVMRATRKNNNNPWFAEDGTWLGTINRFKDGSYYVELPEQYHPTYPKNYRGGSWLTRLPGQAVRLRGY